MIVRKLRRHYLLWIPLLMLLTACGSPTEPRLTPLAVGAWNSSDVALTVTENSANLFTSGCYVGHMPRPLIGSSGRFEVTGTLDASQRLPFARDARSYFDFSSPADGAGAGGGGSKRC